MNSQDLIRQAIASFSKNDRPRGKALLQQAAAEGSVAAVLFYADVLFKEDKQAAYAYLAEQWQLGVSGTLHRRALLRCFFDETAADATTDIFHDLYQEAINGDIQSLIALISVVGPGEHSTFYLSMLKNYAPELLQQLLPEHTDSQSKAEAPSIASLSEAFSVGLARWSQFDRETLNSDINLVLAKNVLNNMECQYLKLRFGSLLKPSMIVDPISGKAKHNPYRTGSMVAIVPEYLDWIVLAIELKMSAFAGFPRQNGEVLNVLHYDVTQSYLPHFDAIVGDDKSLAGQLSNGGQRQKTVLCYLNTVESGGETSFPKLDINVKAEAGYMLMFNNINDSGQVLQGSYHAGNPVLVGEKWILSKWVRQTITDYGKFSYSENKKP